MMLTCKEATRLASQRLDRDLSATEKLTLKAHLAICRGCANVARQMEFLRRAIARLGSREDQP